MCGLLCLLIGLHDCVVLVSITESVLHATAPCSMCDVRPCVCLSYVSCCVLCWSYVGVVCHVHVMLVLCWYCLCCVCYVCVVFVMCVFVFVCSDRVVCCVMFVFRLCSSWSCALVVCHISVVGHVHVMVRVVFMLCLCSMLCLCCIHVVFV